MIACVTPLPPSPTGVSDYAVDLLGKLRHREPVEVFVEDRRSLLAMPGYAVFPLGDLDHRICKQHFSSLLYHIGNNKLHAAMYQEAIRRPGVVVLHDALLQHMLLGTGWDAWEQEFVFTYGERGREIAANLRDGNPATHEGFFRYPLVRRVAEASRRVIVHNQGAAQRVRTEAPHAEVRVIPLPFVRRGREVSRAEARRDLGLPADAFVVGCLGFMREARQLPSVLRVFESFRERLPQAQFAMVGAFAAPEQDSFWAPRLTALPAWLPGFVTDVEFEAWIVACDVVVNLRHPSAGETSGVAVRSMGLGVPVAITDILENSAFPNDACMKIPSGEMCEPLLLEYLLALAGNPSLGKEMGENARAYIRREHDPDRVADLYMEALQ